MNYNCKTLFCLILAGGCLLNGYFALRNVKIKVPMAVVRGKNVELQCLYDLEGENLYSVKWYLDGLEFFRYTPKEKEPIKLFPLKGINVKLNESTDTKVVLENVSRDISGRLSCEVSADMPSFYTDVQTAWLQVVDIPKYDPYITGLKDRYTLGDEVFQANCTSAESYPGANITWYINGLPKKGPQITKRTIKNGNLLTVISTIRHRLDKKLFINNRMKLRCAASIYDVYHQSTEISVLLAKRRKHSRFDLQTTTYAPLIVDGDYNEVYGDTTESEESGTRLWFWNGSSTSMNLTASLCALLTSLFISMGFLFLR